MKNKNHNYILALGLCLTSFISHADSSAQIKYSGSLIALPCTIEPGMDNLYIDMGITDTRTFYTSTRTEGREINFKLKDCSTALGNSIVSTFDGVTNTEGLLVFAAGSTAKGVAIGLEYVDGRPIDIDKNKSYSVPLKDGDMVVRLQAYLKGESAALENRTIVPGTFNAVLTYTLSYE